MYFAERLATRQAGQAAKPPQLRYFAERLATRQAGQAAKPPQF
jgi:hypothetical protein